METTFTGNKIGSKLRKEVNLFVVFYSQYLIKSRKINEAQDLASYAPDTYMFEISGFYCRAEYWAANDVRAKLNNY